MGVDRESFSIWDLRAPSEPVARFGGWQAATAVPQLLFVLDTTGTRFDDGRPTLYPISLFVAGTAFPVWVGALASIAMFWMSVGQRRSLGG